MESRGFQPFSSGSTGKKETGFRLSRMGREGGVCHPERRAEPEVEGSSHLWFAVGIVAAKILRLAALPQNDKLGTAAILSGVAGHPTWAAGA